MFFNGIGFYDYLAESRLNFAAEKQFSEPMSVWPRRYDREEYTTLLSF